MENNDGNIKPQQTGGLKLMTVFIAVLALHVVVIGGFTVYHLMSGGSTDVDMTLDKNHKDMKTDGTAMADGATSDVNKPAATDTASAPASTTSTDAAASTDVTPAPIQPLAPTPSIPTTVTTTSPTPVTPTPALLGPKPSATVTIAPTVSSAPPSIRSLAPPPEPSLAPPPEPTLSLAAPAPMTSSLLMSTPALSAPSIASGPVHMPATTASAKTHEAASTHESETVAKKETYTVKITDSYKKIAKAHHITVAQLKEANNIKGDTLHTGQKLVIPMARTSLAKAGSESTTSLAASPTGVTTHHRYYTVEKGDTLSIIAHKFNTTKAAILAANEITNPTKLPVGKKLKIPATKETRSAGTMVPKARPVQVQASQPTPVAQPAQPPQPVATQPTSPQPVATPELANMTF